MSLPPEIQHVIVEHVHRQAYYTVLQQLLKKVIQSTPPLPGQSTSAWRWRVTDNPAPPATWVLPIVSSMEWGLWQDTCRSQVCISLVVPLSNTNAVILKNVSYIASDTCKYEISRECFPCFIGKDAVFTMEFRESY